MTSLFSIERFFIEKNFQLVGKLNGTKYWQFWLYESNFVIQKKFLIKKCLSYNLIYIYKLYEIPCSLEKAQIEVKIF